MNKILVLVLTLIASCTQLSTTRNEGREEQLQKDFDKLPGKSIKTKTEGVEYKDYPDGTRIVKAPKKLGEKPHDATLEVQPIIHPKISSDIRIKVRYP